MSRNVDYTSLVSIASKTSVLSVPVSQETVIQTLAIPSDGKYKISAQFFGQGSGQDGTYSMHLILKKNGVKNVDIPGTCQSDSNNNFMLFSNGFCIVDCKKGDTITDSFRVENHSASQISKDICQLIAQRIG